MVAVLCPDGKIEEYEKESEMVRAHAAAPILTKLMNIFSRAV